MRSRVESRQAQEGALALQILAVGLINDGLSSVPRRTTVKPALPVESAKRWLPQRAQNRRVIWLPLSEPLVCSLGVPEISIACVGKIALTVPLDEIRWQFAHQQTRDPTGSAVSL